MSSRKNESQSDKDTANARTNGDDLRRASDWILNDKIFADLKVHGNVKWTGLSLVRLAVFWVWSSESSLVAAANDAIDCVTKIFGVSAVKSYQALTDALKRYSGQLIPALWCRLQTLMQRNDAGKFRVGLWMALAVDGSRVSVPRTVQNEECYSKNKEMKKKKKKKKRSRHAKRKQKPTHKKKNYSPQPVGPQMWLTLIWHIGLRLPWCWKMGPSYSSERHHVMELITQQKFPEYTLFCGDAGFVGYDFWRTIHDKNHHFLVRVGGNVRLLNRLGYARERNGIVYCWPDAAMKKKQQPLTLRLLHFRDYRNNDLYLLTNVLDSKLLSKEQAREIYSQRWGIEVQFRSLKQTYGRTKLRSRTPDCAEVELEWSLIGLWMIQLLAHKEQAKSREPDEKTSIAGILRIVRQMMQRAGDTREKGKSFQQQLAEATTDTYIRKSKKQSRNYPRRKEEPAAGKPIIKTATKDHKKRLKELKSKAVAA